MFCGNCGSEVKDGTAFCPVCGNKMGAADADLTGSNRTIAASEKLEDAKEKARGIAGWYAYNWKRLLNRVWQGDELKHHLIWCGAHLAVLLLLFALIRHGKGGSTYTYSGNHDTASATEYAAESNASSEAFDEAMATAGDYMEEAGSEIDYAVKVLFSSLYGTWTNDSETFSLTINKDGTVSIFDATGTFGADLFSYTELDDDTVRLKVVSDDESLLNLLSVDMDYYVKGETLTVSALGQSFELKRKK